MGGASSAGIFANGLLQLFAIVVLGTLAFTRPARLIPAARTLVIGGAAFAAWLLVQCIPLPPAIWSHLPGRATVVDGLALSGIAPGWEPMSLAPDATIAALLALLPPAAMAGLTLGATDNARRIVIGTLIAVSIGAALLGIVQFLGGTDSPFQPYSVTNPGQAVGPFANRNHLATLLLCALPFLGRLIERRRLRHGGAALVGFAVLAGGVVLTGSDAGLALLAVVLSVIGLRVARRHGLSRANRNRLTIALLLVGTIAAGVAGRMASFDESAGGADQRRNVTVPRTLAAAIDHLPVGAGGGSFTTIYPTYTNPALASPAFVNHAHSDYAELLLDHGVVGMVLIVAAWLWWLRRARSGSGEAALIALAIMLLHSLVDYPLRTAAIATIAAFAAALASGQPPGDPSTAGRRRASRELSETFDLG
ncbi:O-antigen ligase family protein [Sphingomonas sp. Leaf4]|uniref:O-antigen ligase family protein n=1 Tax=Sphingomonas sp. Leaf4 TaxID=2876553 RepID=UPI001E56763D|nr:O-antigen ligase family protein [Sphingomonas sp. Leaf4]